MLPDILNYIPDPKNGRPTADGQVYFFLGGYSAPANIADVDASFIAQVTANGNPVTQPIYTSKGGTLIVGSQTNQPQLNVDPLVKRVAVYDKCGRLVYSTAYNGVGAFVDADALAAPGSDVLVGGVPAGVLASEHVNVRSFGAKGDGVTDDTLAIQAAMDYLQLAFGAAYYEASASTLPVATCYFPRGHYIISDEITVARGIKVVGGNGRNHGGSRIKQITPGKACFNLYKPFPYLGITQHIADQDISCLFFSTAQGSAIKAVKPSVANPNDFYSVGSLSIYNNFFLDVLSASGAGGNNQNNNACIDVDAAERIYGNTFDACQAAGIKAGNVGSITGNTFFDQARGAIVLMAERSGNLQARTVITGNDFIQCGDNVVSTFPYTGALCLDTGTLGSIYNIIFTDNTIDGGAGSTNGICSNGLVGNFIVNNNTIRGLAGDAIVLHATNGSNISDNIITGCGNTLAGNNIINLGVASNSIVSFNKINQCGGTANFALSIGSKSNLVFGNLQDTNRMVLPTGFGIQYANISESEEAFSYANVRPATNWKNITSYSNAWSDFDSGFNKPQYRIDSEGFVVFKGAIKSSGGASVIGALAFTLPSGFRRGGQLHQFIVKGGAGAGSYAVVVCNPAGEFYVTFVSDSDVSYVDLSQIRYKADN